MFQTHRTARLESSQPVAEYTVLHNMFVVVFNGVAIFIEPLLTIGVWQFRLGRTQQQFSPVDFGLANVLR